MLGVLGPDHVLMRTLRLVVFFVATAWPASAQPSASSTAQRPPPASPPEAAVDDIVVVTASRREEQLLNAPATMTVLTAETIATAPDQSITGLLRLVPGLNTVQTSARDVNVTTRAATGTLSDSMLVLLDGRSVYQDLFGFVLWDFLPIDPTEIKQIEVIRGPASAVWGANAMTGVINVIAKTPREMQGTFVDVRFGQFDRSPPGGAFDGGGLFSVNASHAAAPSDRFAYKVSAGLLAQEPFRRPAGTLPGTHIDYPAFTNKGTAQPRFDARADYDLADGQQHLSAAAGVSGTEGIIHTGLGPLDVQRGSTFSYGRLTYSRRKLKVQFFVNALNAETPVLLQRGSDGRPLDFLFENQAYDVEFSNLHLWRGHHLVSYGGNYRHNHFNLSFARARTARDEGGAYAQDEIVLSERYRWIVGARVDRFDVIGKAVVSPRTTFLIKPRRSQTIRLSFNRAFRAPSFVNSYFDTTIVNSVDLPGASGFQFATQARGNDRLREERLTAYETGYIGGFGRTTLGAAVYVNETQNMIQFATTSIYTSASPPVGWPLPPAVLDSLAAEGRALPSSVGYRNFERITDRGLELSADVRLAAGGSAFVNYSWQDRPTPSGFDIAELNLPPSHRFNAGLTVTRGRYFTSVSASHVGRAFWQDTLPGFDGWSAPYTLVNGSVGVRSSDGQMAVAVRATNILDADIQQHIFGDLIRRGVVGEVHFQF
jgi:outer membrane receptor protein involved in Fe transport